MNRPLTETESSLARWLLEHGKPEAAAFLPQLAQASATTWRCPCGCASFNFAIPDHATPSGGMHLLADFVFGSAKDLSGIFIYEQSGVLSGLEVYGVAGEAPKVLPPVEALRPLESACTSA